MCPKSPLRLLIGGTISKFYHDIPKGLKSNPGSLHTCQWKGWEGGQRKDMSERGETGWRKSEDVYEQFYRVKENMLLRLMIK